MHSTLPSPSTCPSCVTVRDAPQRIDFTCLTPLADTSCQCCVADRYDADVQAQPGSARKARHAVEGVGALGEDPLGELANEVDREVDQREVDLFK